MRNNMRFFFVIEHQLQIELRQCYMQENPQTRNKLDSKNDQHMKIATANQDPALFC